MCTHQLAKAHTGFRLRKLCLMFQIDAYSMSDAANLEAILPALALSFSDTSLTTTTVPSTR